MSLRNMLCCFSDVARSENEERVCSRKVARVVGKQVIVEDELGGGLESCEVDK